MIESDSTQILRNYIGAITKTSVLFISIGLPVSEISFDRAYRTIRWAMMLAAWFSDCLDFARPVG